MELHITIWTPSALRLFTETFVVKEIQLDKLSQPHLMHSRGTLLPGKYSNAFSLSLKPLYNLKFHSWVDGQIEVQRAVNLPNFGIIGF